jgi:gamma-glutamyltranspeptidase/glutathione hydrolase
MDGHVSRRQAMKLAAGAFAGAQSGLLFAEESRPPGRVEGWPEATDAGQAVLADGGNAVDAIVAGALVAAVVAPQMCGIGGYGGHCVIAKADGSISAIDFNGTAPAAFREDVFPLNAAGKVIGNVNETGWLAAGVPGILAGLQLALDRLGTRSFGQIAEPAIRYARDGFNVGAGLAGAIKGSVGALRKDPASAALLLPGGEPPKAGATLRNPELAALLEQLAEQGRVEDFYRGEIASKIGAAFRANGGLVTETDLAAYQAKDVKPLSFEWNGSVILTPPPTAGGLTVLEALAVLKRLGWNSSDDFDARRTLLETLRVAWRDRLRFLGDPEKVDVPITRLLSDEHVASLAEEVSQAIRQGRPVVAETDGRPAGGTVHLSAADAAGNFAALTLTHGGSFGAKVTVPGLGLTLGHGMSRFDPRPGLPNSPGPGKRPLHNMCPTVVLRDGRPVLALGGRGGRKIPNAVFGVLAHAVGLGRSLPDALAAPRLHTEGGLNLELENSWPKEDTAKLEGMGYQVKRSSHATISAVWSDVTGGLGAGSR